MTWVSRSTARSRSGRVSTIARTKCAGERARAAAEIAVPVHLLASAVVSSSTA